MRDLHDFFCLDRNFVGQLTYLRSSPRRNLRAVAAEVLWTWQIRYPEKAHGIRATMPKDRVHNSMRSPDRSHASVLIETRGRNGADLAMMIFIDGSVIVGRRLMDEPITERNDHHGRIRRDAPWLFLPWVFFLKTTPPGGLPKITCANPARASVKAHLISRQEGNPALEGSTNEDWFNSKNPGPIFRIALERLRADLAKLEPAMENCPLILPPASCAGERAWQDWPEFLPHSVATPAEKEQVAAWTQDLADYLANALCEHVTDLRVAVMSRIRGSRQTEPSLTLTGLLARGSRTRPGGILREIDPRDLLCDPAQARPPIDPDHAFGHVFAAKSGKGHALTPACLARRLGRGTISAHERLALMAKFGPVDREAIARIFET